MGSSSSSYQELMVLSDTFIRIILLTHTHTLSPRLPIQTNVKLTTLTIKHFG